MPLPDRFNADKTDPLPVPKPKPAPATTATPVKKEPPKYVTIFNTGDHKPKKV